MVSWGILAKGKIITAVEPCFTVNMDPSCGLVTVCITEFHYN